MHGGVTKSYFHYFRRHCCIFFFLYKWVLQWKTKCSYYNLMNYIAGICFLLLTRCKCAEIHVPFFLKWTKHACTHTAQIYLQIMLDLYSFTWCAATHVTWTMRKLNVKAVHVFLCKSVSWGQIWVSYIASGDNSLVSSLLDQHWKGR